MSKKLNIHPRIDKEIIEIKSKVSDFTICIDNKHVLMFDTYTWYRMRFVQLKMELKQENLKWKYVEQFNRWKKNQNYYYSCAII